MKHFPAWLEREMMVGIGSETWQCEDSELHYFVCEKGVNVQGPGAKCCPQLTASKERETSVLQQMYWILPTPE